METKRRATNCDVFRLFINVFGAANHKTLSQLSAPTQQHPSSSLLLRASSRPNGGVTLNSICRSRGKNCFIGLTHASPAGCSEHQKSTGDATELITLMKVNRQGGAAYVTGATYRQDMAARTHGTGRDATASPSRPLQTRASRYLRN